MSAVIPSAAATATPPGRLPHPGAGSRERLLKLAARVATWQLCAAGVVLAPPSARFAVAGPAAGLVAVTAIRIRGRWLSQWLVAYARFRRRVRFATAGPGGGGGAGGPAPLDALIPGADTRVYADRAGNRVGLITYRTGWTAVLRLESLPSDARLEPLIDELGGVAGRGDIRVAAVQLVVWTVPAPDQPTPRRAYWVAVRFDPARHPEAVAARGGGEKGAIQSAGIAALRVAMALRRLGYGIRVLDGTELRAELGTSLGLAPPRPGRPGQPVTPSGPPLVAVERWSSWSIAGRGSAAASGLHHVCLRPRREPSGTHDAGALATALTWFARPPAVSTCGSMCVLPSGAGGSPRIRVAVRISVPGEHGRGARSVVRRALGGSADYLIPMDGEQLAGVRATIPLAAPEVGRR